MRNKKKIVAIIQARLTSTRLPKKILLDVCGKSLLWHVVERVKQAKMIDDIVLAIPDSPNHDELESYVKQFDCNVYRGSEYDVLSRYYHAAIKFKAGIIVRVTSDCPLVDPIIIDNSIEQHIREGYDYTAVGFEGGFSRGLDVEVVNFKSLEIAYRKAVGKSYREHVTLFIYQNPKLFKILFIEASGILRRPDIRLTVDTEEDLHLIREIYSRLKSCNFSAEDVYSIIDSNAHLKKINQHIVQKNVHAS